MISPLSITIRWRKLPRTIATAASSSDHSGEAKTTLLVRWSPTVADRVEDVALGEDAGAGGVGVQDHGRADAARRHGLRRLPQGVAGPHHQDHAAHPVAHLHPESAPLVVEPCNDCLKLKSTTRRRRRQSLLVIR
jgi:hypothetical protein